MKAELHPFETARLLSLNAYEILNTPAEAAFDRLTRAAAYVLQSPIALVSFVAEEMQFIKSCFGISISETPRDVAFCAHTILHHTPLVVVDASHDIRFADNPLVTGPPHIRFYAGAPLIGSAGYPLGALCCIDFVPHEYPSEKQLELLTDLAAEVVGQLELRNSRREMDRSLNELARVQRAMLHAAPETCRLYIDLRSHPKYVAGGDFLCRYRVSPCEELVLLTDVSGHDLKAAYLAAHSQGMVRAMLDQGMAVGRIFEQLNGYLFDESEAAESLGTSLAACAMLYNSTSSELTVLNYGSPAPVYIDVHGSSEVLNDAHGFALGWFQSLENATTSRLLRGGFLLAWTDGLEDLAFELGVSPLNLAFRLHRGEGSEQAPWLARARDDVMSALVALPPDSGSLERQRWIPILKQQWDSESADRIDSIQQGWERDLQFALPELSELSVFDILLCTREAALNGMIHGCRNGGKTTIDMRVNRTCSLVRVIVSDEGQGHSFDPATREDPDLPVGHRGLMLIHKLAKQCTSERNGACLTMEFAYKTGKEDFTPTV